MAANLIVLLDVWLEDDARRTFVCCRDPPRTRAIRFETKIFPIRFSSDRQLVCAVQLSKRSAHPAFKSSGMVGDNDVAYSGDARIDEP